MSFFNLIIILSSIALLGFVGITCLIVSIQHEKEQEKEK